MTKMFDPVDLEAQATLRCAFDPAGRANPTKVLPGGSGCGDLGTGSVGHGDPATAAATGLWL